ncbi:hypothetical protein SADUNF_Sadunf08G0131400 [Salix dunnii]|uniref:Uncharacterized protein n=1 Tax=Salix dunnii TaxID=1413687 RepID=A0A835JX15_9ROSI|nr:hypothetical protein SADUNF_Sadunf08G0131400 [Salix dunnii]
MIFAVPLDLKQESLALSESEGFLVDLCGRKREVRIQNSQRDFKARFRQEDFKHRVTLILILLLADTRLLMSDRLEMLEIGKATQDICDNSCTSQLVSRTTTHFGSTGQTHSTLHLSRLSFDNASTQPFHS